jgi:hypothetical protein
MGEMCKLGGLIGLVRHVKWAYSYIFYNHDRNPSLRLRKTDLMKIRNFYSKRVRYIKQNTL